MPVPPGMRVLKYVNLMYQKIYFYGNKSLLEEETINTKMRGSNPH